MEDQSKNPLDAEADPSKYSVCRISRLQAAITTVHVNNGSLVKYTLKVERPFRPQAGGAVDLPHCTVLYCRLVEMYHSFHNNMETADSEAAAGRGAAPRQFSCPYCGKRSWRTIETFRIHKSHCRPAANHRSVLTWYQPITGQH